MTFSGSIPETLDNYESMDELRLVDIIAMSFLNKKV